LSMPASSTATYPLPTIMVLFGLFVNSKKSSEVMPNSAPGIYARAFVEGRLTEEQMDNFRRESDGKGVPSYPHPWLMKDFWQFPTTTVVTPWLTLQLIFGSVSNN